MSAMFQVRSATGSVRRARWPLVVALLVALAATLLLLTHRSAAKPVVPGAGAAALPMELATADIATVELRALSRSLPLSGSLSPLVQTSVKAKVAGELLEVTVREGQAVHRGDVIARIDLRNLRAQYDSQVATLEKARADLALARTNRDTSAVMLREKFISQNAYDSAESSYQAAAASARAAEAQARLAQIGVEDALVRAPIDGIVSKRLVEPGEKVSPDTPLFAIVDLSRLELEALAPASEIPAVKVGQVGHFHVGGFGERHFEGRVERINPVTEAGSRSIKIWLSVDNRDGALRGGMYAQGELVLDRTAPVPAIPVSAVRSEAGVDTVLVVEDGHLRRRDVMLGLRTDDDSDVEVRSGLAAGARVLAAKIDTLKDGSAVVLKDVAAEAAAPAAKPVAAH